MAHDDIPKIDRADSVQQYVGELISRVFRTQLATAKYFNLNKSTIHRYQRDDLDDKYGPPPLGFIAALIQKFVTDEAENGQEEDLQSFFLTQMNTLLKKHASSYGFHKPLKAWEELARMATEFQQTKLDRKLSGSSKLSDTETEKEVSSNTPPSLSTLEHRTSHKKIHLVPQLPPQGIFGREQILADIIGKLSADDREKGANPALALRGMGGVGKTTLAISIGHNRKLAETFPDGVLWVELGPQPVVRHLLNMWGEALGIQMYVEKDERACETVLRDALYGKRALLIVDDVWNARDGAHFNVGGPQCRTVFTTRELGIANALTIANSTLKVDVLTLEYALEMLHMFVPAAADEDVEVAKLLCQKLECLPLGIKLAGQLLANESDVKPRMKRIVGELTERGQARLDLEQTESRLGLDDEKPHSIRAILGMSVDRLDQLDKERFAMLGMFGGEPLTWDLEAATAVWDCTPEGAQDTTARLIKRALVEPRPNEQYWMHALLADYAEEMCESMGL